jgi:GTP-binding protein Era
MMAKAARRSLSGIDAIIYLIDASSTDFAADDKTLASIKSDKPLFIVFSKIDLATAPMMEEASKHFAEAFPGYRQIQSSALENFGLKEIREAVASVLPEAEPLYPEGLLTDKDRRFAAKEAIREMLLHFLKQEVPHQCGVVISSFKEKKDACEIEAKIYCEKESQKGIIIGKDGAMIKRISMSARRRLEKMWQMNVTLVCEVECLPGWRNDPALLKKAGYGEDADD